MLLNSVRDVSSLLFRPTAVVPLNVIVLDIIKTLSNLRPDFAVEQSFSFSLPIAKSSKMIHGIGSELINFQIHGNLPKSKLIPLVLFYKYAKLILALKD